MDTNTLDTSKIAGRATRTMLATYALFANGLLALLALTFSCCGGFSPNLSLFVGAGCGALMALLSIPPISTRARKSPLRSFAVFPAAIAIISLSLTSREMTFDGSFESIVFLIGLITTTICTFYVVLRVVIFAAPKTTPYVSRRNRKA